MACLGFFFPFKRKESQRGQRGVVGWGGVTHRANALFSSPSKVLEEVGKERGVGGFVSFNGASESVSEVVA